MRKTINVGGGVVPVTVPGRVLALIWMAVSVIAIAVFTAGLTSALTSRRLQGVVTGVADLTAMRVGVVAGTVAQERLSHLRVRFKVLPNVQQGLAALQSGKHPAAAALSGTLKFVKRVTLSVALRLSGDAGRGFGRAGASSALVAG